MRLRRLSLLSLVLILALVTQAQAATIHMRFFESTDVTLDDERLQVFSVSMLQGEFLTVVAYGMEEGVLPGITLIDPNGSTVAEDLNAEQRPVAYVQQNVPANGMYTFIVSRQGEVGGLIRVMVFEGEPLEGKTLIDTLDPFAPSRAFMLATDPQEPIDVSIDVIEPEGENVIVPEVFGSRATAAELPPTEELTTPLPEGFYVWENSAQTPFYTINVRPFPEVLATSLKQNAYFAPVAQAFEIFDYILCVDDCGEPERVNREICTAGNLEVVGISQNGQFYQVVDPSSSTGFRLVPVASVNVDLTSDACSRVQPVDVELPVVTGGGGGGGGLFGLPPGGDPPPADPSNPNDGVDLFDPTQPPGNPPSNPTVPPVNGTQEPTDTPTDEPTDEPSSIFISVECDPTVEGNWWYVNWSGAPADTTMVTLPYYPGSGGNVDVPVSPPSGSGSYENFSSTTSWGSGTAVFQPSGTTGYFPGATCEPVEFPTLEPSICMEAENFYECMCEYDPDFCLG